MSEVITITLSKENCVALENLTTNNQIDDIVNQAIRDYLFSRQLKELRAKMTQGIEKLGITSDEDVFAATS